MKRDNSYRPTSVASVVLGCVSCLGLVACVDGTGLGVGSGDAGTGGAVGQGGASTSNGGVAGSKGLGGVTGIGGAVASGGQSGGAAGASAIAGSSGTAGGGAGAGGKTASGGNAGMKGSGGTVGGAGAGGAGGTGGQGGGSKDAGVEAGKPDGATSDASGPDVRRGRDSSTVIDSVVACGPVCAIYCAYGNVLDNKGCPTCQCNPAPVECPLIKCKACTYGYLLDEKGCQTCTCAPDPGLACSERVDSASCDGSDKCRWLEPGCGTPALAAAGCYESATIGCTPDGGCSNGRTCLERVIDPCYQLACDACGQSINICL